METTPDSDAAAGKSKEHLKAAADDFKTAASAKADEIRKAAEKRRTSSRRQLRLELTNFAEPQKRRGQMLVQRQNFGRAKERLTCERTQLKRY